ncbi:MAG TPA: HdeD family acid-resistance protein [Thermoanaerobaculia bacterium]
MGETMNRTMDEITDTNESMDDLLSRSWWMLALRGVLALAFGILALIWPGLTLAALVALFAAYALISGVVSILGAIKNRKADREWWLILILGLVSVAAGVISIMQPALTALVLVLVMGANALVIGVLDIAVAIRLRKTIEGEWLLIAAGIASIIFGILVFLFPGAGALALVWLISAHVIATGILLLALAFRARGWGRRHRVVPTSAVPGPARA